MGLTMVCIDSMVYFDDVAYFHFHITPSNQNGCGKYSKW